MLNKPKYLQVKDAIKDEILNDNYPKGSKIPSELELTKEFDVSRHTIRQAISELVNDGFLTKVQGSGTYVSEDYLRPNSAPTKKIGVITTYVSDYIFPSIIRGIEEEINMSEYSLMLSSTQNNVKNEKESLEKMLNQEVDGLIVEPTKSSLLNPNLSYYLKIMQQEIPLLMLHAKYEELDAPVIIMDDEEACRIATEHLIKLGHTKIAKIAKTDDMQGKRRFKGFINALTEHGLTFDSHHIISFDTETQDEIPEKVKQMIESTNNNIPTAFVCYNDQVALQLIRVLQALGKKVPDDFSIVSHDDSFLSESLPSLRLTSVIHPKEKMGRKAAQWLINAIETNEYKNEEIVFVPELHIGNSTKPLQKED